MMLVDLHAHFPMQLLPDEQQHTHERAQDWWRRRWRAQLVRLISHFANYEGPGDEPSVSPALMRAGDVKIALSVVYQPFDEMDLSQAYGASPRPGYIGDLLAQLETVEDYVKAHPDELAIAHTALELEALMDAGRPILIHAVEGGFHLGDTEAQVTASVRELASRGVAYVTLAHLFFRDIATNAPALPFLPDWLYHRVFPQPASEGLTGLGRAAVAAMVQAGVLIDITHMSPRSVTDAFALLDEIDPDRRVPIIATHMACRFGKLEYCLDAATVQKVAARGGVLGTILCEHYITDGLGMKVVDVRALRQRGVPPHRAHPGADRITRLRGDRLRSRRLHQARPARPGAPRPDGGLPGRAGRPLRAAGCREDLQRQRPARAGSGLGRGGARRAPGVTPSAAR